MHEIICSIREEIWNRKAALIQSLKTRPSEERVHEENTSITRFENGAIIGAVNFRNNCIAAYSKN